MRVKVSMATPPRIRLTEAEKDALLLDQAALIERVAARIAELEALVGKVLSRRLKDLFGNTGWRFKNRNGSPSPRRGLKPRHGRHS